MLIIPAIDLRGGRVVRLYQGRKEKEIIYSDDPIGVARGWVEKGAKWLHVVDLDGAFSGSPKNLKMVRNMVEAVEIPIEFGGGMRSLLNVEWAIEAGVERVILGSVALSNPEMVHQAVRLYGERIMVAIDARGKRVYTSGWERGSRISPLGMAKMVKSFGIERIIYTDILRDGTMRGPNIEMTKRIAQKTGLKVIASGGVSTLEDIKRLKGIEGSGVEGIIIGKAFYEGKIRFEEALKLIIGKTQRS
jgi:phosphoribosylformimino-5-aminoimidazole carboxamide ribotide isomerase